MSAYSSHMRLRSATGSLLTAILLLTFALPAMCGQCRLVTSAAACAEEHGGSHRHDSASTAKMSCDGCEGTARGSATEMNSVDGALAHAMANPASCPTVGCPESFVAKNYVITSEVLDAKLRGQRIHATRVEGIADSPQIVSTVHRSSVKVSLPGSLPPQHLVLKL
jgi:hypothetical protein